MQTNVVIRRIAAVFIDGIILFVMSAIVLTTLEVIGINVWDVDSTFGDADYSFSATSTFGGTLVSGGLSLLYKAYQEGTYNGQTLGKRVLNIRAVKEYSGAPISMEEALIRGVFWQAPFTLTAIAGRYGVLGLIGTVWLIAGLISLIASPTRQRLGDRVAGTVVIRDNSLASQGASRPQPFRASAAAPVDQPQGDLWSTCAYCQSRFPQSRARQGVWQGQNATMCPNCGAPLTYPGR
jgi:uncharacterized RDD family membrane protein YckC